MTALLIVIGVLVGGFMIWIWTMARSGADAEKRVERMMLEKRIFPERDKT